MTDRLLFGIKTLIDEFTKSLTETETLDGGWATKYLDKKTGHYWIRYIADDRNFTEHLIFVSPQPTTEQLIDIALTSTHPDEVFAASTRLLIEEQTEHKEFRKNLLGRLSSVDTSLLDTSEKDRIKTIIEATQLTNALNRRKIVGKHLSEIKTDSDFFVSTAEKAQRILNTL